MDFANYWEYTDFVTKALFFILIALSVVSWITGIVRIYHSYKMKSQVSADLTQAIKEQSATLKRLPSAERKTVAEQILLQHIGRYRFKGEKGLPIIGTTAAIAPFIGLFGTVWGIFHALHSIGQTGQAVLSQVAGPVGEALIMTGLGLAVAIPAVVFYNIVLRVNRRTLFTANDVAYGILGDTAKLGDIQLESKKMDDSISNNISNNIDSNLSKSATNNATATNSATISSNTTQSNDQVLAKTSTQSNSSEYSSSTTP